jgi:DNA-binding LytR/AlgR family response regulator
MFIRKFPNENFYSLDVIVVLIFSISGSLMYTALFFFRKYEETRRYQAELAKKTIKEGVTVKLGNKEIKLNFGQILAFYSEGKQTWIITRDVKRFPADLSLDKFEEIVPENFFRVNRRYLLIPETIKAISPDTYGKVKAETVETINIEPELIISRDKASAFKQWFRKFAPAV